MRAGSAAQREGFAVGWYGKIPGTGDFITRRVPVSFSEPWDRWLQQAIEDSRARLGGRWRDAFLSMPAWRFVLGPGALGANAWAGLMVPSVDAVVRYFPLTVASALPPASLDAAATLRAAARWFHDIETVALQAIAPAADTAAIDAELARCRFDAGWLALPEGVDDTVPMRDAELQLLWSGENANCAWLAEACELFGRTLLLCERLPSGEQFCAMMNGRWADHGWGRRNR